MKGMEIQLTLYSKPDCHLCDEMEEVLLNASSGSEIKVTRVDITKDPELEKLYGLDIPLLTHKGKLLAKHKAHEKTLAAKLRKIVSEEAR
jgi:hypothetical protein